MRLRTAIHSEAKRNRFESERLESGFKPEQMS